MVKLPKFIIFVGYPGSGKTTLRKTILQHYGIKCIEINQDEMGKYVMDQTFNDNLKNDKTILIDGCNLTIEKRKEWIKNKKTYHDMWCIFMNTPYEECLYNIARRKNHPTIKGDGRIILESVKNTLVEPDVTEGYTKLIKINNNDDLKLFLSQLDISEPIDITNHDGIIKFPRTKHLINTGSATKDDIICTQQEIKLFLGQSIIVEEKIDGANLGIYINKNYEILVQNRSHYVNSSYHPQFKILDKWIHQHTNDLLNILEIDNEILYGEWMYFKHSIHYTDLPDYFLAYDIFNITLGTFISREKLNERLKDTSIQQVPIITTRVFKSLDELKALVTTKSQFYDGPIEGVYLRISHDEKTTERSKIVRHNFITSDEHWTKGQYVMNIVKSHY